MNLVAFYFVCIIMLLLHKIWKENHVRTKLRKSTTSVC